MTPGEAWLLALAGGLLALDRTGVGQFGVSQPIVVGPLVGWLLGDVPVGLAVGSVLQLLYTGAIPIGASVPADEGMAALVATGGAVIGARLAGLEPLSPAVAAPAVLAGLAAGEVGRWLDIRVRQANVWFAHRADAAAERADDRRVAELALGGLLLWFGAGAGGALVLTPAAALAVGWVVPHLADGGTIALGLLALALAVFSVASALAAMRSRFRLVLFVAAFTAGAVAFGLSGAGSWQ